MEKDIAKIQKNPDTDIVVRIDDFGGRVGVTIREFVRSERYTGFTKSGTRISAENFKAFKDAINSISEDELKAAAALTASSSKETESSGKKEAKRKEKPLEADETAF